MADFEPDTPITFSAANACSSRRLRKPPIWIRVGLALFSRTFPCRCKSAALITLQAKSDMFSAGFSLRWTRCFFSPAWQWRFVICILRAGTGLWAETLLVRFRCFLRRVPLFSFWNHSRHFYDYRALARFDKEAIFFAEAEAAVAKRSSPDR
jgi:hypothetical protein